MAAGRDELPYFGVRMQAIVPINVALYQKIVAKIKFVHLKQCIRQEKLKKLSSARSIQYQQPCCFSNYVATSVLIIWHIWPDLGRFSSGLPDDSILSSRQGALLIQPDGRCRTACRSWDGSGRRWLVPRVRNRCFCAGSQESCERILIATVRSSRGCWAPYTD